MAEALFGTDGFRGPVDDSKRAGRVNAATFCGLSSTYASLVYEQNNAPGLFVVGSDTRDSSPELREAVCQGIASTNAEVWDLGVAPTPVIAWIASKYSAYAISVTASHNPGSDNGFKPFSIGGTKPPLTLLTQLEKRYFTSAPKRSMASKGAGKSIPRPELMTEYLQDITENFGGPEVLQGKTIVVDGANGAAYDLAPKLYRALGAEVIEFACSAHGTRINRGCGAAHLEGVATFLDENKELAMSRSFLGAFASDGDGDRVMGLDALGRTVDGNYWLKRLAIGQVGIVGTIYTNSALREAVTTMGVEFHECANGDSHVTSKLQELSAKRGAGFTRGGEFTGHLIDLDHLSSGDGLYMGAWLATQLMAEDITLLDIKDEMELWPEKMVNVRVGAKDAKAIVDHPSVKDVIGREQKNLGSLGRVIVRASGTEPLIRVWAEAEDSEVLEKTISRLLEVLQPA